MDIIAALHEAGARVRAYDPQAIEQARPMLPDVTFCQNAYACAEFDLDRVKQALSEPVVVDLRNRANEGFAIRALGVNNAW